jgi:phage terminase large subunit
LPYASRIKRDALPKAFDRIVAGLDFGYGHPTALTVIGQAGGNYYIVDEVYKRALTSFDIVEAVKKKSEQWKIKQIYCDWARPEIIKDLQNAKLPATEAIKTVFDGILYVQGLVNSGRLYVANDCAYTLREFDSYVWARGDKDQPLKINDDALDAVRYCLFSERVPEFKFKPITANNQHSKLYNPFNPFDPANRPATNTGISF